MSYKAGYGSRSVAVSGAAATAEIVATGITCVLDAILIDGTATSTDSAIEVQDQAGNKIHAWKSGDLTAAWPDGLSCGPYGFVSSDGLQVVTTGTNNINCTVLVRVGFA